MARHGMGGIMRLAETVTFGGSGLDRAAHLRADEAALGRLRDEPSSWVLPLWRGKPLFAGSPRVLGQLHWSHPVFEAGVVETCFLGRTEGGAAFAADLSGWEPDELPDSLGAFLDNSEQRHPALPEDHAFAELRAVMAALDPRAAELAATAKAVLGWHTTHRFCAKCGARSRAVQGGWQRDCPECKAHHFPRTDPVVIMLITHGNDVLVGRSPVWPEGMYSLLAGFVEPGETIEAAVRRETFEEAGIDVGPVTYLASQPWPFPSSLMLGCQAEATTRKITLDPAELEDAQWVSREEMSEAMAGRHPRIKAARKGAIAHFILSHWLSDSLD